MDHSVENDEESGGSEDERFSLHCDSEEEDGYTSSEDSEIPLSERWEKFKLNFQWKEDTPFQPVIHQFADEKAGIQQGLGFDNKVTPIELFEFFYSEDITSMICEMSNIYHEECLAKSEEKGTLKKNSRHHDWDLLTRDELFVYYGLIILMGIIKKPSLDMYWSTNPLLSTPIFGKQMSRNRFQSIMRFLHYSNDNFDMDKLKKIRPLYELFNEKFKTVYRPLSKVSIDESLLKFKGRLSIRQCNLSKRARFGIKIYKTCCSVNGYIYAASIYVGKSEETDDKFVGVSGKTALKMLCDLSGEGRTVYLDNWYSSPTLFQTLYATKNNAIGTVKLNRKHMPKLDKKYLKTIKKNQVKTFCSKTLMVMLWRDKKLVNMLSTSANADLININKKNRKTGEDVYKPRCVTEYNENMGGVDKSDQLISSYDSTRKSRRWYQKLANNLMEMTIFNCHVVYNMLHEKPIKILDFKTQLAREIFAKYNKKNTGEEESDEDPREVLSEDDEAPHFLERIEDGKRYRCAECKLRNERTDTSWWCSKCKKRPFCKNCYKNYHENKKIAYEKFKQGSALQKVQENP